jgi:hypothetical protein
MSRRVSRTAVALHGRSAKPRVTIFRPWRRHPVTGRAWQAEKWSLRYTERGQTIVRSTGTADRAEAERIAQEREAALPGAR